MSWRRGEDSGRLAGRYSSSVVRGARGCSRRVSSSCHGGWSRRLAGSACGDRSGLYGLLPGCGLAARAVLCPVDIAHSRSRHFKRSCLWRRWGLGIMSCGDGGLGSASRGLSGVGRISVLRPSSTAAEITAAARGVTPSIRARSSGSSCGACMGSSVTSSSCPLWGCPALWQSWASSSLAALSAAKKSAHSARKIFPGSARCRRQTGGDGAGVGSADGSIVPRILAPVPPTGPGLRRSSGSGNSSGWMRDAGGGLAHKGLVDWVR